MTDTDPLREALENMESLVSACEAEYTSEHTEAPHGDDAPEDGPWGFPDDEAVSSGADGDGAITFGHIRRARQALATLSKPEPAAGGEPVAIIGANWRLHWASPDNLSAIVGRTGIGIGSKLYASPVPSGDDLTTALDEGRWLEGFPSPSEAISSPDARAGVEALAKVIRESVSAYEGKGKVMPNLPLSRHMAEAALAALQSTGASQ